MGLDMYLHAKRYLSSFNAEDKALAETIKAERVKGMSVLGDVKYIECEAVYWRKANQIHKWFVDNVQDGEDDCKSYYVSIEQLKALHGLCEAVLLDRTKAEELLPFATGFFFGSDAYDEGYFDDVEYTKTRLQALIECTDLEGWSFEYTASW
jgi:hypothetical protein